MKALDIDEELKDRVGMSLDYTNIGLVYYNKGQLDECFLAIIRGLDIDEELKNKAGMAKDLY